MDTSPVSNATDLNGFVATHKYKFLFILSIILYSGLIGYIFKKEPKFSGVADHKHLVMVGSMIGFVVIVSTGYFFNYKATFSQESHKTKMTLFKSLTIGLLLFTVVAGISGIGGGAESSGTGYAISYMLRMATILLGIVGSIVALRHIVGTRFPNIVVAFRHFAETIYRSIRYRPNLYGIGEWWLFSLSAAILVGMTMYLAAPMIQEKIMIRDGKRMTVEQNSLRFQTVHGSYNTTSGNMDGTDEEPSFMSRLNITDFSLAHLLNTGSNDKPASVKQSYRYAVSSWIFLESQPPNTNRSYSNNAVIFDYGINPRITYNATEAMFRVEMTKLGTNRGMVIFETNDFPLQKWCHLVVNCDGSTVDIFINNELMVSVRHAIPQMEETSSLIVGQTDGLYGGVKDLIFYSRILSKTEIDILYLTNL